MFADQALELEGVIGFSGGQRKKTNTHQRCERAQRLCSLPLSLPGRARRGGLRWLSGYLRPEARAGRPGEA